MEGLTLEINKKITKKAEKYTWDLKVNIIHKRRGDGMSLRNGIWHDARNGIIMRNTIYAE